VFDYIGGCRHAADAKMGRRGRTILHQHLRRVLSNQIRDDVRQALQAGNLLPSSIQAELGMDTVFAEVLPDQKAFKVKEVPQRGKRVAVVGDGVDDAPALLTADVGIAIGAGTDVTVEAGDIVLVRSDPGDVPRIVALSKATDRKMIQNLWWAAGYNILAMPLAQARCRLGALLFLPRRAPSLMSLSTIVVAVNARLLRRAELQGADCGISRDAPEFLPVFRHRCG
jgi:hypothetical protein